MDLNTEIYIKSIENEYYLDKSFSDKRNLKFNCFRAETFTCYSNSFIKLFFYLLLIPVSVFFSRLNLPRETSSTASFICSKKSQNIFSKYNGDTTFFGVFRNRMKFAFNFKDSYCFIVIMFAFIKRFKFSFWFYPELILIPEMIRVNRFLENANFQVINITNQYDRWAYFISSLDLMTKVNIIQHGILSSDYYPKNKIRTINRLVCYNKEQLAIFKRCIVEDISSVCIQPPSLHLHPDLGDSSILLCGTSNREYQFRERELYNVLSEKSLVDLYIRPHPNNLEPYTNFDGVFLGESYPKVSILIHFNSTLALEYKNSDPEVVTINAANLSVGDILKMILSED